MEALIYARRNDFLKLHMRVSGKIIDQLGIFYCRVWLTEGENQQGRNLQSVPQFLQRTGRKRLKWVRSSSCGVDVFHSGMAHLWDLWKCDWEYYLSNQQPTQLWENKIQLTGAACLSRENFGRVFSHIFFVQNHCVFLHSVGWNTSIDSQFECILMGFI